MAIEKSAPVAIEKSALLATVTRPGDGSENRDDRKPVGGRGRPPAT